MFLPLLTLPIAVIMHLQHVSNLFYAYLIYVMIARLVNWSDVINVGYLRDIFSTLFYLLITVCLSMHTTFIFCIFSLYFVLPSFNSSIRFIECFFHFISSTFNMFILFTCLMLLAMFLFPIALALPSFSIASQLVRSLSPFDWERQVLGQSCLGLRKWHVFASFPHSKVETEWNRLERDNWIDDLDIAHSRESWSSLAEAQWRCFVWILYT